jgi:hypothetical protein
LQKFPRHNKAIRQSAQTAIEYLLLLSVMVILALTAFRTMLPEVFYRTNGHVGNAISNMVGEIPQTGESGPYP